MAELEVGAKVPIELQLEDGVVNQFPRAVVFDNVGGILLTIDLPYSANGWYYPVIPYTMPDEVFIAVVYIVYSVSDHSIESSIYGRSTETFIRIDVGSNPTMTNVMERVRV